MNTEQDADRNEAATPFKLQQAREQGRTPRSADMVSSAAFLAAMLYIVFQGQELARAMVALASGFFAYVGVLPDGALWPLVREGAVRAAGLLLPLMLVAAAGAILGGIAQTGFLVSLAPLKADFDRLNPAQGFKRLFSPRVLFEGLRACIKLGILAAVGAFALQALIPQFPAVSGMPATTFLAVLVEDVGSLGWKMAVALVAVSTLDILYTRHEFGRQMRMSRRELKEEFRHREGDPRIRARLRELRKELLQRARALQNTRTATVVLTNPTHYAVALRYLHGEMAAPRVVAKGAGHHAAAIRAIAARHAVVVVQNPPLARRLFRDAPLEQDIPPSFHADVARILVWVLAARRAATGSAA